MIPTLPAAADRYLDEVRRHLTGLPEDEREDLLDDLQTHVREVAAEDDRPLDDVLGPPAAFAAEVLAAAGVVTAPPHVDRVAALRARGRAVAGHPALRAVRAFLPELRPAWWVLRGYVAVLAVSIVFENETLETLPFPKVFGSVLIGVPLVVGAIVASVRLGRRRPSPRWVLLVDVATVVLALMTVGAIRDRAAPSYEYIGSDPYGQGQLLAPDGRAITNLFPYDGKGDLLEDVLIYDQDGRPVLVGEAYDPAGGFLESDAPVDANGAPIGHAYPKDQRRPVHDPRTGTITYEDVPPPAVVVPRPARGR